MGRGINKTVHTLETVLTRRGSLTSQERTGDPRVGRPAQAGSCAAAPGGGALREPAHAAASLIGPLPVASNIGVQREGGFRVGEPIQDAPEMPAEEKIKVTRRLKVQPDLVFRRLGS